MKFHSQLAIRSIQQPERIDPTYFLVFHKLLENKETMGPSELLLMRKLEKESISSCSNDKLVTVETLRRYSFMNDEASMH